MTISQSKDPTLYQSLDTIKVFFIILVIARHIHWYFHIPRIKIIYIGILSLVDIFMGFIFLMSGLGLSLSMHKKPIRPMAFYLKRFMRIYPLYVFSLFLYMYFVANIDISNFFVHLLNLHNFFPIYCHNPKPLWFMGIIFQFYLLFPILFVLLAKYHHKYVFYSALIYILYASIILSYEYLSNKAMYISSNLQDVTFIFFLVQFSAGMYVGRLLYQNDIKQFNRILRYGHITFIALFPATMFIVLVFNEETLYYLFKFLSPIYCFATTSVCLSLLHRFINRSILGFFSRISSCIFATYLFHEFILSSFAWISKSALFGIGLAVPFTLLFGFYLQGFYDKMTGRLNFIMLSR